MVVTAPASQIRSGICKDISALISKGCKTKWTLDGVDFLRLMSSGLPGFVSFSMENLGCASPWIMFTCLDDFVTVMLL